ncbi:MAG: DUF1513 domain-containing protein [Pseudomonadota bacterium]
MALTLPRRAFLATAGSAAVLPSVSWAEVGAPHYLAAAQVGERYRLLGLGADGAAVFDLPLPARGHAAAVHPSRAEAVAFARRPGRFAIVVDCADGRISATLDAPPGRHFYGHGAFSADGQRLFTTENAYATGDGRIGIWDAAAGYRRLGDMPSGGVGPHDMLLLPDGETLAVANGGIRTHPETGREKLNLPTMQPNLSYLRVADGTVHAQVGPPPALRLNSIRHLAVSPDGLVAAALQWQGEPEDGVPLLAFHRPHWSELRLAEAEPYQLAAMQGYAGSVAFTGGGTHAAITSPRGGRIMAWRTEGGAPAIWSRPDVCGLAAAGEGWIATDGLGGIVALDETLAPRALARHGLAFDNHLIPRRAA